MVDFISTLGLQLSSTTNITSAQTALSQLSQQLSSGKYSSNLTDYSSSDAQRLMNFNSAIDQQNGFLDVISTISTRMEVYDSSYTGIEDTVSGAYTSLTASSTYNESTNASLQGQIEGYMSQIQYYLNQKVGDRYIFSGSRYDQAPVGSIADIDNTTSPLDPTGVVTSPAVPAYDTDYNSSDPTNPVPEAYTKESATIDTSQQLTYGSTSDSTGMQQVIMGLRYAYAATKDPDNYESYMATARSLLSDGLANVRADHTASVNAYTQLNTTKDKINTSINNMTDQVENIENVDVNEVAVKITTLQAQLEASYAATAKVIGTSILQYLS